MSILYFRITEEPDPVVLDRGWTEIVPDRFVLDERGHQQAIRDGRDARAGGTDS